MKRIVVFCLMALTLVSASAAAVWEKVTTGGTQRDIKVYVPDGTPTDAPLVIACHGANQSADWHDSNSKWAAVSDTAKFVLVFPEGVDKMWDVSGDRDINFILAIIDQMHEKHGTSLSRVYLSGFSMGGMLTYHCANRIPDRIAAFVPVSGYPMGDKSAYASRPVPIMHVHGTGDDVCVFSGVQPTLDNWIAHNHCNLTPVVIKPYPANKPSSGATLTKWVDGTDGVEVQLLKFKDKGHWQSEDPNFCLTSIEAWNFMKQWSLGPDGPKVGSIEPEDGSFDLPLDGMEITLTFDMGVDGSEACAKLEKDGESVSLGVSASGNALTLAVPAIEPGDYLLTVGNVKGENGGVMRTFKAKYTFGVQDLGDNPQENVIFCPDLRAEQSTVGEGIPTGWYRVNSRSNGEKDEKGSGSANTGGARMKYFEPGGDFAEGFYLSARDYDKCEITYGKYTPDYALRLEKGQRYVATFNSAFWNEGSMSGDVRFDFTVKRSTGAVVATFTSLPSSSNLGEQTGIIEGSTAHECEFEVKANGNYTITYSMSAGWAAVIVGNLKITTAMTPAEKYKGAFLRALKQANDLYDSFSETDRAKAEVENLREVIEKYESFVSTSPTAYTQATRELTQAIALATSAGIAEASSDHGIIISTEHFNALGQPVSPDAKGLIITRIHFSDGACKTVKSIK